MNQTLKQLAMVCAMSSEVDVPRQVLARDRLLIDGAGNGYGSFLQILHLTCNGTEGVDACPRRILHRSDLIGALFGRATGLHG